MVVFSLYLFQKEIYICYSIIRNKLACLMNLTLLSLFCPFPKFLCHPLYTIVQFCFDLVCAPFFILYDKFVLSLSCSLFHHAIVGLLFVSEDVLGMVFSAACSMLLTRQLCASIVFWFFTFIVIVLPF